MLTRCPKRPRLRHRCKRLVLTLAGLFLACSAFPGVTVHDDSGHQLSFDAPPMRIVSLLPSLTEIVCALDACDRLVGVDRYSDWPASVQKLAQVGGSMDPSAEAIIALQPDVVLASVWSRSGTRLDELGIKVAQFKIESGKDVERMVQTLAQLLQLDGAAGLLEQIHRGVTQAAQSMPAEARGQSVYFEVSPAPHAAGSGSFMDELLRAVGLTNIMEPALGPFPRINPEQVVRSDPELIMVANQGTPDLMQRPGWSSIRALQTGRVCFFDTEQRNILVRPGPRMPEAARLMVDCVRQTSTNKPDHKLGAAARGNSSDLP